MSRKYDKKDHKPPNFDPERDAQLFRDIYECGGLTSRQISALHFGKTKQQFPIAVTQSNCRTRLTQLHQYGYLDPIIRDLIPKRDYIYRLTRKGIVKLAGWLGVPETEFSVRAQISSAQDDVLDHHELRNNVRVALMIAAAQHGATITEWRSERYFKVKPLQVPKKLGGIWSFDDCDRLEPDDFFALQSQDPHDLKPYRYYKFIELDRGTETGRSVNQSYSTWERKIRLYRAYYNSGAYRQEFGTEAMVVLTITTSETRLRNLKRITEEAGGKGRFWFTTIDKVTSWDVLTTKIWQVAATDELRAILSRLEREKEHS